MLVTGVKDDDRVLKLGLIIVVVVNFFVDPLTFVSSLIDLERNDGDKLRFVDERLPGDDNDDCK